MKREEVYKSIDTERTYQDLKWGGEDHDVAPLFKHAKEIENIHLPKRFWKYI